MNAEEAWQSVLMQLQPDMPRASFDTWVRDTKAASLDQGVLVVSVRDAFMRDWLESRLTSTVQRLLVGIVNESVSVQFVVRDSPTEDSEPDGEEEEQEVTIEPVQWLDYEKIVRPQRQVVVKGYLRRLGMEIGPKAIWLYIGFHQAAWMANDAEERSGFVLHSRDIMRFSGLSFGAFWRSLRQADIQKHMTGLVQRIDPSGSRCYRRGRDGRPHRIPIHYRVFMTPRLTRCDASALYTRLREYLNEGSSIEDALQRCLSVENVLDLLVSPDATTTGIFLNTVMDVARATTGLDLPKEADGLAQELHRKIINVLGEIHITHYFITEVIRQFDLTPAQAWLLTVARDMAYLNWRTGERREVVNFKRGYKEMAELIGSQRPKTIQAWFNPGWDAHKWGGDLRRFMFEMDTPEPKGYADLRTATIPRTFRVLLDEPLDADGPNKTGADGSNSVGANGSNRPDADGSNRLGANGTNIVDADGTVKSTLKHPLNTHRKNTHTTQHTPTGVEAVPASWELKRLLRQNHVHPKVQRELSAMQASVKALVSWVLYAASSEGKWISESLAYAISRVREDPATGAGGAFDQLAAMPPQDLKALIDLALGQPFGNVRRAQHPYASVWREVMGSNNFSSKLCAPFSSEKEVLNDMRLHFLNMSWQRARGAMFSGGLKEDALVFVYPRDSPRLFHTCCCPPLRLVALCSDGQVVFDQVIPPLQFVRLPACQYVIETAPENEYQSCIETILSMRQDELPQRGALDASVRMDSLLFALLAEAVADIRRIREAHRGDVRPEVQRRKFEAWERGQIVSSAGFLLDFSRAWTLPSGAVKLSYSVLRAEAPYLDELVAASVAGIPWRHEFPNHCIRCGKPASWRPVLNPALCTPTEIAWRYQRPENAVPICHHCTETLDLLRNESLQIDLAWGLWGPRFEAFWQWHKALQENYLPEWDQYAYPLWPREFGGGTWETGSGALKHAEPRPPHDVARTEQHLSALRRALFSKRFRGRQPGEAPLQRLLDFRLEFPEGESR